VLHYEIRSVRSPSHVSECFTRGRHVVRDHWLAVIDDLWNGHDCRPSIVYLDWTG